MLSVHLWWPQYSGRSADRYDAPGLNETPTLDDDDDVVVANAIGEKHFQFEYYLIHLIIANFMPMHFV